MDSGMVATAPICVCRACRGEREGRRTEGYSSKKGMESHMDTSGIEPDPSRKCKCMLSERDNQLHHMPAFYLVLDSATSSGANPGRQRWSTSIVTRPTVHEDPDCDQ